ncbi:MAG: hypothetical protein R3A44_25970 [Caldilineaceae bacterium]
MGSGQQTKNASTLLSSILKTLLQEWVIVFEVFSHIYEYVADRRIDGVFEVLEYDDTLELQDPRGEIAVFKRRIKVRFLQDYVIAFQDYAWGDGNQLANYRISPGQVVDKYLESGRWNILVSLRETKMKGDVEE